MKIKVKELDAICLNCEGMSEFLRGRIGSVLLKLLHDSADDRQYDGDYARMNDAWFYNCPSEEDIFLCMDYLEENGLLEEEVELDVL